MKPLKFDRLQYNRASDTLIPFLSRVINSLLTYLLTEKYIQVLQLGLLRAYAAAESIFKNFSGAGVLCL